MTLGSELLYSQLSELEGAYRASIIDGGFDFAGRESVPKRR